MTDFFMYRSCDLTGLGVRETIAQNADSLNRGAALLGAVTGVPEDDGAAAIVPTIDVGGAEWGDLIDGGTLRLPGRSGDVPVEIAEPAR